MSRVLKPRKQTPGLVRELFLGELGVWSIPLLAHHNFRSQIKQKPSLNVIVLVVRMASSQHNDDPRLRGQDGTGKIDISAETNHADSRLQYRRSLFCRPIVMSPPFSFTLNFWKICSLRNSESGFACRMHSRTSTWRCKCTHGSPRLHFPRDSRSSRRKCLPSFRPFQNDTPVISRLAWSTRPLESLGRLILKLQPIREFVCESKLPALLKTRERTPFMLHLQRMTVAT